jgi:ribosomal protein S1
MNFKKSYEDEEVLDVKVQRVVKGGLIANIEGLNGFIPASHASANYISDLEKLVGQEFKVKILDFDKEKRRIILSRKEIEKIELAEKKRAVWEKLEEGITVEGTVQRLTDFGAFVDLGGVDGLIHISDLSWNRIKHPSKIVNPGDKVKVLVLSLDKAKNRISLGLKQMVEEPWDTFKNNSEVGDVLKGKVVNLLDFGAFVRLYDGVDGLLHVSQISQEHVDKPSDVLSIDDEVTVKILDINYDDKKISLSIKEIEEEEQKEIEKVEEQEEDVTIGDIVSNKE